MSTASARSADVWLLFTSRVVRLFAYGSLSVILVLYLAEVGLREQEIGLLLTMTLIGDTGISLWITTRADRIGRKRMLIAGAALMMLGGLVFAFTGNFWLLILAATVGVLSPSGNEVGPFLAIEQAALAETVPGDQRTRIFAWYHLAGSFATAAGALACGVLVQFLQENAIPAVQSYRVVLFAYAGAGLLLAILQKGVICAVRQRIVRVRLDSVICFGEDCGVEYKSAVDGRVTGILRRLPSTLRNRRRRGTAGTRLMYRAVRSSPMH